MRRWILLVVAIGSVALATRIAQSRARPRPLAHFGACDFDFPVGPPDAVGYYDAQPFGTNAHLGNDWNGNGGGDSDLGDPVFAIADGRVVAAGDLGGGWGRVVRVTHRCSLQHVEAIYAHFDAIEVEVGTLVARGARIGTIGTAGGQYPAHLHFELRTAIARPIGEGYGEPVARQIDATAFIREHRPE
ncbi:MAG TPA: M23 family metallopeptidase [Nannocystaceae bacterium]|nr:M23 family metallopeptidase [Nannocystaceae bacterium]